jgi:hypothetical protein
VWGSMTDSNGPGRRIDRVLDAEFTADLPALPLAELRARRAQASAEENDLSYLRRVLHGRIDILAAEAARRAAGDDGSLVSRLAEILSDPPSARLASARHQPIDHADTGEYRNAMEAELSALALPDLATCPGEVLRDAAAALGAHEREVSDLRRKVQLVTDEYAAELARRYREGEAAIDDLLVAGQ